MITVDNVYGSVDVLSNEVHLERYGTFDPANPKAALPLSYSIADVAGRVSDAARSVTGTLSAAKFHRNYGIKLPVKYTKDLKKGFRHVQTMQDLARNYPEMKRLLDKQLKRESETSQMSAHDRETTDPYFVLDKKSKKKVNRALLDGDRGFLVFDDKILKDLYNLNPLMKFRPTKRSAACSTKSWTCSWNRWSIMLSSKRSFRPTTKRP